MSESLDRGEPGGEHWAALWGAVYGNLMCCVAVFFLLQYIFSRGLSQEAMDAIAAKFGGAPGVNSKARNELSAFAADKFVKLDIKENRMKIIFGDPVLFKSGRADLLDSAKPHLQRLADSLKKVPNPVQIEGHTDDQRLGKGSPYRTNWQLSSERAYSVLIYLQEMGVPPSRLSAIGYGEYRPLRPNDSAENRAINRRIEITLVRIDN